MKVALAMSKERGAVVVLFAAGLATFLVFLVFVVDIARILVEKRAIQNMADILSLGALHRLGAGASYALVEERVVALAEANGVGYTEVTAQRPRCGVWLSGAFVPHASEECDRTTTAIEVTVRRDVPLIFQYWLPGEGMSIVARAVGYLPPTQSNCIRPFGIEESALSAAGVSQGGTFTIRGTQGAGNWGKIDLDGNSSSGTVYTGLMLDNQCDAAFAAGNWVSAGTGNAQISNVFETMLGDSTPPFAWQNLVFAVTSDFPQGNGLVQIRRFMRVDLVSQRGTGQGWMATVRVMQLNAEPDPAPSRKRELVE